jgi:Cu+-exporting ATPase
MVEAAQAAKAPIQKLVDRVSAVFVPLVIVLAAGAGAWWFWQTGDATRAMSIAVATLVVACPCALGLATPMALLVGTGRGARSGIIIRGTDVLESTRRIDTIVFDKTGTLTAGRPAVVGIAGVDIADSVVLSDAARIDIGTDHPIARAIVAEATARGLDIPAGQDIVAVPGYGVVGLLGSTRVRVGNLAWALAEGGEIADELRETIEGWVTSGHTVSVVTHDDRIVGAIAVSDPVRPSAAAAVASLSSVGLRTIMASGDSAAVATRIGEVVGVDEVRAPLSPADKRDLIAELQAQGRVVAMVGDGINDAAALAQADCGIAMGGGTDVAIESSDIVIVSADIRRVADAIRLSRSTLGTIRGNLVWAFGYNALAIPVAMLGIVGPAVAGVAMALSSVFVVLNSARLALFRLRR